MPCILSLAPLHGVTNRYFRNAFFRHFRGFDAAMAPFILSVACDGGKGSHFKDLLPEHNTLLPIVPQILSGDASSFAATAGILADLGYSEVNWNLGCPYPMVVKKGRGAGLLPYPERVEAVLDAVCSSSRVAFSVKLRLGLGDKGEILRLMPTLNRYPLRRVIIHPRIGTQMYAGRVDFDGFEAAADLCAHPLAYNGDINDAPTFEALRRRFPSIEDWMIGRGAVRDPFLPSVLRGEAPPADRIAVIAAFHDDLYGAYRDALSGPSHALDKMKELWTYLGSSFAGCERELKAIGRAKTLESYHGAVGAVFSKAGIRA